MPANKYPLLLLLLTALFCCLNGFSVSPLSQRRAQPLGASFLKHDDNNEESLPDTSRRRMLNTAALSSFLLFPQSSFAADTTTVEFARQQKDFGYAVRLPENVSQPSNKPLKTHLDEVNFSGGGINVGITVDPVRINSLKDFGTPEEVAARVVTAEVNRDGVFQVTLVEDPVELSDKSYLLKYLSQGKRGNKRNVCKIFIQNQKLYVLTAQAKEDVFDKETEKTIQSIVDSFTIQ